MTTVYGNGYRTQLNALTGARLVAANTRAWKAGGMRTPGGGNAHRERNAPHDGCVITTLCIYRVAFVCTGQHLKAPLACFVPPGVSSAFREHFYAALLP